VLAQTSKADAFADTGAADNGIFTTSNGADWFYSDLYSWGYKPIGVGLLPSDSFDGRPLMASLQNSSANC